MIATGSIALRLAEVEPLGPTLRRFRLEAADGGELPVAAAGAHIQLRLKGPGRSWRNAYSLTSPAHERDAYEIVVRRVEASRGGSAFLHEGVAPGAVIESGLPNNFFGISHVARRHLLISGGIGLTPFLAYLHQFAATGQDFVLHHLCREDEVESFARLLAPFDRGRIHLHPARGGFDLAGVLGRQPLGTHVYTCGPKPLMTAVADTARALGWPGDKLHSESFGEAGVGGAPFTVQLARSGIEVKVGPEQSLLEALEASGIDAPCLCRGGACGECRVALIEGTPEHRDDFLSPDQRAAGELILTCVSRAKSPRLVIDL